MYNKKQTGKRIRILRNMHGYTQEELAEQLGFHVSTLRKIERGENGCTPETLCRLSELFNVSTDLLLTGSEHNKK